MILCFNVFMRKPVDKLFLLVIVTLLVVGFFIFLSASLGLLAREGAAFSGVVFNQSLSLFLGVIALFLFSRTDYRILRTYSLYIFIVAVLGTAAVFIPDIGFGHGGATRWLSVGSFSLQPSEFLKISFILYFAAWLAAVKGRVTSVAYGLLPFLFVTGIVGFILLKQPDTGTFAIIFGTAGAMFLASGASWKHIWGVLGVAFAGLVALAFTRPYVMDRILTFFKPAIDPQGAGYQIQQSLIAIGSGEFFGRGFGQSVQKFSFLPEPISDSIFSVFSEEFGFVGGVLLITLFVLFALRGFIIAKNAPDVFSRLTVLGIVILITGQAFVNIGSMLNVFPLTGLPLPFVSHGGTALIVSCAAAGIVLNISRHSKS